MISSAASCRQCRQAGEKLFLKGARCRTSKCSIEKGLPAPGQHGKKPGAKKTSEYGKQLREKQKVKLMYGLIEEQFKRFFNIAVQHKGGTGENLLSMLESRLDNVVFRLKMAISRRQARQMIVHGLVTVNNQRVKSPSFLVSINDIISFTSQTLEKKSFVENVIDKRINMGIKVPEWLELKKSERKGVVLRSPVRTDIVTPIEEHLIVELYSK
ncbi:30S ribosomal protein S4 [Candidatus Dependentiae bacterium]|nr:MAG: 30S ribosomal protein S4 [Candidatus Dependentiae bacterium]